MISTFLEFLNLKSNDLITEAKVGAYSDEHAHARIWNHMTKLGIAHDKKAMMAELKKAKTNKKHPLHFDNAADHEGFVGGKKTASHKAAYHAEHENAIHTIHALATHADFKDAVKNGHIAQVTGGGKGKVSSLWEKYGATKGATSKTDIAIMHPNAKTGEGIRISLKKGGGSQLMSAGPEEHNAVHHAAADEMLATHPKYKNLSKQKKASIHAEVMKHIMEAGRVANKARTAKNDSELEVLKVKSQKLVDKAHDAYPELNEFVRKEATTGRAKFGSNSPYAASYIVKSAANKKGVSLNHVDSLNYAGKRVRAAKPKGKTSKGFRSINFKVDEN
jgi:hypothetical protein